MKATKINAGLAESNGRLLLAIWRDSLHVTCGLTACTPGSAPGPTLGNEYGKTLPFYLYLCQLTCIVQCRMCVVVSPGEPLSVDVRSPGAASSNGVLSPCSGPSSVGWDSRTPLIHNSSPSDHRLVLQVTPPLSLLHFRCRQFEF